MRAPHLRRSRASPEVTLGRDAPAPARAASPEDSPRRRRQLRRRRRSSEERGQKCLAGAPACEGTAPPAKPCVPGGNLGTRCTSSGEGSFPGGQPQKTAPTTTSPPLTGGASTKMFGRLHRPKRSNQHLAFPVVIALLINYTQIFKRIAEAFRFNSFDNHFELVMFRQK